MQSRIRPNLAVKRTRFRRAAYFIHQLSAYQQQGGNGQPISSAAYTRDLQRPLSIEFKSDGANNNNLILASRQYQYNPAGNITQKGSDLGQTQYAYDKLSRLTQASPDPALQNLGLPQERYGYDPVGNRTSSAHQTGQWSYNQDNQLLQYPRKEPFSASTPTPTQVSYTPQGHTAQEKTTAGNGQPAWQRDYRYDAAERLVETTQNGQTVRYRYDPTGRRISKSSSSSSTGNGTTATSTTTYYLYSDTGLMAEADAQGTLTRAYGWNPQSAQQGLWSTDPLWQAEVRGNNGTAGSLTHAATRYDYLHTDHLATPILATTKDGATSWKAVSEAFGATATVISAIEMNLRFPMRLANCMRSPFCCRP